MRFLESICFRDGEYQNLDLHQERMNRTSFHFFGESLHKLSYLLPEIQEIGIFKVRLIYDNATLSSEYMPYEKKTISSIQIVETSWFDYSFKYENRTTINELMQSVDVDEIMISIDGLITDSSYANLAFWNGTEWLTPETPLLEGVKRAALLRDGKIKKAHILKSDLGDFEKVSLINSMLDLGDLEISTSYFH